MAERRSSAITRLSRVSPERTSPLGSSLDERARESLNRHVRLLIRCGLSRPELARELQGIAATLLEGKESTRQTPSTQPGALRPRGAALASQVLTEWCTDPKYSDGQGRPVALPKHGRRSMVTLARRISRSLDVEEVIAYLKHTGTIARSGRRYHIVRQWVSTRGTGEPNYLWSLHALAQTLQTLEHNLESQITAPSWFYRIAERAHVPACKVAEIDRLLERKGMALLRWFDAYLHQCALERRPGERTVWYGLGLQRFEYPTPLAPMPRGRRQVRAREARGQAPRRVSPL